MCRLLAGMASVLEVEDEPEETNYDAFNSLHEHARIEELARRNTLYLPHLRSVYPTELFSNDDSCAALSKDAARSSVIGGASKDGSRSSIAGGHASAVEGHFNAISRSSVVETQAKDFQRSRLSSAASILPETDVGSQENIKHKVSIIVVFIIISIGIVIMQSRFVFSVCLSVTYGLLNRAQKGVGKP